MYMASVRWTCVLSILFLLSMQMSSDNPQGTATGSSCKSKMIFAINTWPFTSATDAAYKALYSNSSSIDSVVAGCSQCEVDQCDGTVGWGGSPDEDGHSTLDALIMEGDRQDTGAVIQLKSVREASQVARAVLHHTHHSILVGENATNFALKLGFEKQSLSSPRSIAIYKDWIRSKCQPNFWKNMINSTKQCGPYQPEKDKELSLESFSWSDNLNHDTIGMIALDSCGRMAVGTSTNGATHKIPGRSSDSAIPGSGAFVDNDVGGAVATGDGDVMMRFSPSFLAVELMRNGATPTEAAEMALTRIYNKYPFMSGAIVTASNSGKYGAACYGFSEFAYSVRDNFHPETRVIKMKCPKAQVES